MKNANINVTEDLLIDCFRVFLGGHGAKINFKAAWWSKMVEAEELGDPHYVIKWVPNPREISIAELVIIHIIPQLVEKDRRIVFIRCGKGRKNSYRKCSRGIGISHEAFRQEFQRVIKIIQNAVDKI